MRNLALLSALAVCFTAATAHAAHNNPWAGPGDTIQGKNHDTNQAFSADRPGEDEMRGVENSKGRDTVPGPQGSQKE